MYCHRCGYQVEPDTRFCPQCGTALSSQQADEAQRPIAEAAEDALRAAEHEQNTLKEAVHSTRKRSLRRMPTILLVALILALVSSIAYAAYRVYTDIYLPGQQTEQEQTASADDEIEVWVVDSETHTIGGEAFRWVSYDYDDDGKLVATHTTEDRDGEGYTSQVLFSYDGAALVRIANQYLSQTYGGQTYDYDGAIETTLAYDDSGRCIQAARFVTREGTGGSVDDFTYDDDDHIATLMRSIYFAGDEPADDTLERTMEYDVVYSDADEQGTRPTFVYTAGDASYPAPSNTGTYTAPIYDEDGNLTSIEEVLYDGDRAVITYTYKRITVKRDDWIPNPYSNPAFGAGDLSNYQPFTQYSLRPERVEQILAG